MEFVSVVTLQPSYENGLASLAKHYVKMPKTERLDGTWTWRCNECKVDRVIEYDDES
jgi:ubiquitin C-terminal hydrolase